MGEGHSSVSEVPSDVGELDRVRFRVDGEGGGESSSVELATEREVDDVFFLVGGGYWCSFPHGFACHCYCPLSLPLSVFGVCFLVLQLAALSGGGSAVVCRDECFCLRVKYFIAFNPGRVLM